MSINFKMHSYIVMYDIRQGNKQVAFKVDNYFKPLDIKRQVWVEKVAEKG